MQKINIKNLFRLSLQNEVRPLHFVLANRGKEKLGEIDNVFEINYHPQLQTYKLDFIIYKTINNKECRLWDEIISRRLLWVKEYDEWFEISVDIDDSEKAVKKTITATALCQAELSNINLDNAEINTQADIERTDYAVCTFYNPEQPNTSILHRLLKKVPNYTIKHVDNTLYNIQRSFSISDNANIYDFLTGTLSEEIGCLFLFDSNERGIYVYDMQTTCLECGHRDEVEFDVCPKCGNTTIKNAYGDDTTIFVSKDNLGEGIQLTSNANEVKNCYKVSGGDDIINAAIINSNPNGTNTIYAFDDDTRRDMSVNLVKKLDSYNTLVKEYKTSKKFDLSDTIVEQYNSLISKINSIYPDSYTALNSAYTGYSNIIKILYNISDLDIYLNNGMMPTWEQSDKTAQSQISLIESELTTVSVRDVSVISKSTADNAVLLMVKAIIDSNIYKAEIINSTLSSQTWTGQIKLTNYSDEAKDDTATSRTLTITINDDMVSFVEQRIQKETAKIDTLGVSDVLTIDDINEFKTELKKYCLASLKGFLNAYQTVLDILIEENMSNKSSELYDVLYLPYYEKLGAIENEISVRESDIEIVSVLKDELQQIVNNTHEELDFENYLGEDLWNTFLSYRREDNYSNEYYISDGLTNDEVIAKAEELIEVAYKELIKSSSKQYIITATLHNLLLIVDEEGNQVFAPILDDFTLGNFIRCKIDGVVYKMRIMDVTIDYDNLNKLSITFGDVSKGIKSIVDKMSDVIKQTNSIAASYSAVKKQAKQGETANYNMEKLRQEGLNSAQYNVFNTNSTFIMDEHGLLGRNYDDVSNQFSLEQLRINGSNIILSSDGGKSTDLAVGKQTYTINGVQYEDYCVNAKTVIGGKVIAGDIFSANYTTDENGNIIKGNHFGLEDSSFELADGKMIYDNSTNTLKLKDVTLDWNTVTTPSISNINGLENELNNLNNSIKSTEEEFANEIADYAAQFNGSISDLQNQIDGNITTWFYDGEPTLNNSPANEWTAVEDKNRHLGDLYYDNLTGYAYRFQLSGTIYFWVKITDSDVTKALADAKNAQDTADNKRRVFVTTPIPPYDIGDLWVQGEDGELMKCIKTRTDKETFSSTDWAKASKYTDDSALHSFVEGDYADDLELINQQIDKKSETWYQNTDPSVNWTTDKLKDTHVGDLWFNIDENKSYIYISSHSWQEANGVPDDVYDKIDGKAQIFSSQPTTPYYEGDLYVQGVNGDIYVCQTERLTGNYSSNDWVLASKYTDDTELYAFINGDFKNAIDAIKSQSDQKAETWYQETDPSLNWSTEEKQNHVGDLWYSINNEKTYIWNGLSWDETKSTPPSEVFDEIDGKAQIFINQPNPPYKEGDLWFNDESSDIMTCIKSKLEGTFASSDWEKRNKYTDDSALTNFINGTYTNALKDIGTQIDQKARSWYQSTDPSLIWDKNEDHEGDLWYNTSADSQVTSIYQDNAWKATSVPKSLFDTIDGIASIYITVPENPVSGDLLIPTSDIGNYKTGKVYRYNGTTWIEISYTDDTKANEALDAANKAQTSADNAKSVADNAKIIGDNLVNVLGYDGTKITGTYIYSPVISGGTLLVGNKNGTYAEITTDGVLNCAGANFQGSITGGDININNRFIVSSNGDVTLPSNATITWGQVTDSPTIPSAVSDLENDLNFATKDDLDELLDNLPEQSDAGVDTYYQETQPYDNYPSETEINAELEDKVGDIWFNTVTRKTYQYIRQNSETQGYDYYWKEIIAIPDDVYDKIDGKRTVYVKQPTPTDTTPYYEGDLWILEKDVTLNGIPYIKDTILVANLPDSIKERTSYVESDWIPVNTKEGREALEFANSALNQLSDIANDLKITPSEKQQLSITKSNIDSEYTQIIQQCKSYNVKYIIYDNAYMTLDSYILSNNILADLMSTSDIDETFSTCVKNYYNARANILNDIDEAIRKYSDNNMQTVESEVKTWIDNTYEEIIGIIDGKVETFYQDTKPHETITSANTNLEEYDAYVGDVWFDTNTKKTYEYALNVSTAPDETDYYEYYWSEIDTVPNEVFDAIDGKKTIYTSLPTSYEKDDMYILESARGNWTKGTILTAIVTATSTSFYSAHWQEPTKYTDDTLAQQALDEATQAIKDAANGINLAKTAQARAEKAEANAEKYAKDYADTQDNTLSTNLTTAYENYTDSKISDFDNLVAKYLGLSGNTLIGNNYIISPIIQGGYANITNSDNGSRVIIDPNNLTKTGYIFQVHNGEQITIGIGSDGHATFQGTVYANAGEFTGGIIGGWDITETDIYNNQSTTSAGIGTYNVSPAFWAGTSYNNRSSAPFRVTHDGSLYANKAVIEGEVIATSGKVGKLEITDAFIEYNGGEGDVVGLGATMALYAGSTNSAQAPFRVGYDGSLYANNATITGSITATSGKIGRYEITDTYLEYYESSTKAAGMGGNQAFYAGNSSSDSAPFRVGYDGSLYSIKGEIAGWTITEESFVGSTTSGKKKTQLNSNGTMELFCYNENVTKRAQFSVKPGNIIISPNSTNNGLITLFSYEFTSSMIEKLYELATS